MTEIIDSIGTWLMNYGILGLFFVSFTESSFFPIPPDVLMIPMGIANPDKALLYALVTTVGSVLGALLGWYIGKKVGRPVLRYFISEERILKVEHYFQKYGAMAILIAGFTPIPYKVFTIFSGVSNVKISKLLFWSVVGRGLRFFLEAAIIIALGDKAKPFIEENFGMLTGLVGITAVAAYVVYLLVSRKRA
ncbi:YqaA family protein [Mesobacillus zeae]|uniref:DedA family protein n=1 Tax=Mesobacillus zeae TaxID=1917180 RepID=A0A398B3T4_9BACI|nr:YqaA family protein [Mesobacillus zeae]RID84251.1 DedA family protein [Mesobacillus zeae]